MRYNPLLDRAIESALQLDPDVVDIMVNINSPTESFESSAFWRDSRIQWRRNEKTLPIDQSWTTALRKAESRWLYLLSDDDRILPGFLEGISLQTLPEDELVMVASVLVDTDGRMIAQENAKDPITFERKEIFEKYFSGKVLHHASLLIFSRALLEKIGGFFPTGFPNSNYLDTVFHGKAFALASRVHRPKGIRFERLISASQASSAFYFDRETLTQSFRKISDALCSIPILKEEIIQRFSSIQGYEQYLLKERFWIDHYKIHSFYGHKASLQLQQCLHLLNWPLPLAYKFKTFSKTCYLEIRRITRHLFRQLRKLKKPI